MVRKEGIPLKAEAVSATVSSPEKGFGSLTDTCLISLCYLIEKPGTDGKARYRTCCKPGNLPLSPLRSSAGERTLGRFYPFAAPFIFETEDRCMKIIAVVLLAGLLLSCSPGEEESLSPRYIITSPEVGEIIYLLQGAGNIIGVAEEVDHPEALREIPKVGRFGSVSREKIISLRPDIVFTSGLEQEFLAHELNKAGINTVLIYPQSIPELLEAIREIAVHLGIEERGVAVADSLQKEIEQLRYQGEDRPKVYLEIYSNPIMSVSSRSFIGELLEIAGGINIFEELPRDYSRVRSEDVINADPGVIILTYPGISPRDIKSRKGWQNISACQNDRIYGIKDLDPDLILRAGPRITEGLRALQRLLWES